jgi:hypothetical protein
MYVPTDSLYFDRLIAQAGWSRRRGVILIGVVLLLLPFLVAYLEAGSEWWVLLMDRRGRQLFFYPLMITYWLAVIGPVQRTEEDVARAIRPLAQVDDGAYVATVAESCRVRAVGELAGIAAGVIFFLALEQQPDILPEFPIASRYVYFAGLVMFGVIGWSIFVSFTITRLTNSLLRLPVEIDIFNTEGLSPIGRQSLYLALVFIGAILLSLFFIVSPSSLQDFLSVENLVIYGILITLTVGIFFLNMHRTHALLAAEKAKQLSLTEHSLAKAYYALQNAIADGEDTLEPATTVNALSAGKRELRRTRTWPYNTEMLQTLAISIVTPLALGLARVLVPLLTSRAP